MTTTTDTTPTTTVIDMKQRLWDANRLAKIVLRRDHDARLEGGDLLEAIRVFADMKSELDILRKLFNPSRHAHAASPQAVLVLAAIEEEEQWLVEPTVPAVPAAPAAPAEIVAPTKVFTLAVGSISTIGELEICIVSWTKRFEELNETHEQHSQECQAQLEQALVRLQDLNVVVHPSQEIKDDKQQAAEARQHLDKLIEIVAAFPSQARLQDLEQQLLTVQQQERKAQQEITRLKRDRKAQQDPRLQEDLLVEGSNTNHASKQEKRERSQKQVRKLVWQYLKTIVSKIRVSLKSKPNNKGDSSKEPYLDRTATTLTPEQRECKTIVVLAAASSEDPLRADIPSQVEFEQVSHPTIPNNARILVDDLNFDSEEEEYLVFDSSDRSSEDEAACYIRGDEIESQLSGGGQDDVVLQGGSSGDDILEELAQALESPVSESSSDSESASLEHESDATFNPAPEPRSFLREAKIILASIHQQAGQTQELVTKTDPNNDHHDLNNSNNSNDNELDVYPPTTTTKAAQLVLVQQ
jgi:hypothetical protein